MITVLLAESGVDLQNALNIMPVCYCRPWNLQVNTAKIKAIVCSKGKIRNKLDLLKQR